MKYFLIITTKYEGTDIHEFTKKLELLKFMNQHTEFLGDEDKKIRVIYGKELNILPVHFVTKYKVED